jgi:hypothetical protein
LQTLVVPGPGCFPLVRLGELVPLRLLVPTPSMSPQLTMNAFLFEVKEA